MNDKPYMYLCYIFCIGILCSNSTSRPAAPILMQATATSLSVPVLKGLDINPILKITVSNQYVSYEYQLDKLSCTLSKESLASIQKIDLYHTGAEPFSSKNLITSFIPSGLNFSIPTKINLKPGVHIIWFSVVLKENADIKNKIDVRCMSMKDSANKITNIKQPIAYSPKRIGVALRKINDEGVHTYRIPGITKTNNGTLIAVYDIRYTTAKDLPGNIDVGMSRSTDQGNTWEPMKIIMDMGPPHENNGVGDPSILYDPATNKIFVAALWSKGNRSIAGSLQGLSPDSTGQFVLVSSEDDGISWSKPYSITPQIKDPKWHVFFNGPGMGIVMKNGNLVYPAQYWDENKMPYSTIVYSEDHGKIWKGNIYGPKSNTTESQLVETNPGTLMLNMRDNRGSYRSVATTSNMGKEWIEHTTSYNGLPDPVCMASIIKVSVKINGASKEVLFFSNANTSSGRSHITVKASIDLGESWLPAHQLLIDERLCYGYSCLTKIDDSTIGLIYEGSRELYFVRIPIREIIR